MHEWLNMIWGNAIGANYRKWRAAHIGNQTIPSGWLPYH